MSRYEQLLGVLRLNRGDGHRIDDIVHRASPAQIIDRFLQSLKHWANGDGARFALDGLVSVVARVEIGKDKDRSMPGHFGTRHLFGGHPHIYGSVVVTYHISGAPVDALMFRIPRELQNCRAINRSN